MRRVEKEFSGRETPLFPTMMVQAQEEIDNVADEAVYEEMVYNLEKDATTATSLDAEQDRGSSPRRQETMGDTIAQTGFENVSKTSNDSVLAGVGLSRRVESSEDKGLGEEDASKQGRIADIDADAGINLVSTHFDADTDMFGVHDLVGDEVVVETEVASKDVNLSVDEVTLAQALAALKSAKPKADKVVIQQPKIKPTTAATTITAASTRPKAKELVIHEQEQAPTSTPIVSSQQPSQVKVQDKGKGIMVEEPLKMKKKDQVSFDEQEAIRLQAEFDEEDRLAREKDEANVALIEEWNDIQVKIDVDYQLAQRLKHFAAKRAEEKRNKPPTRAQQRSIMCTYLKNMKGWKPKSLKNKSFANIQELLDKAMKRVNTFVDYRTELVKESFKKAEAEISHGGSLKRAGEELKQESSKKQKLEEDKESEELKQCLEINCLKQSHVSSIIVHLQSKRHY
ncbi:hypothetical protein Tco_0179478 [Tanacetum coccineum]